MKKSTAKLIYFPSAGIISLLMILGICEKNNTITAMMVFLLIFGTMGFLKILNQSKG